MNISSPLSAEETSDGEILLVDCVVGWDEIEPRPGEVEIKEDPDGNDGNDVSQFYRDALTHNGFTFDEWKVFRNWDTEMPPLNQMKEYSIIIWFFGDSDPSMLSENPFAYEIPRYLESGGNILIIGNRVLPYIASTQPSFQQNFLHASISGNSSTKSITGTSGDFIGDGFSFDIEGGDGADNNKGDCPILDTIDSSATAVFKAGISPLGIRTVTDTFNLVYLSFNFESIHSSSTRDRVMQRIVYYLRGRPSIEHTPLRDTEDFNQSFNVTCEIRGMDLNLSSIQLIYHNGTKSTVAMTRVGDTDTFEAQIPRQSENTTVDYYIKVGNLDGEYSFEPKDFNENDRSTYQSFFIGPDKIPPTFDPSPRKNTIKTDGYTISTRVSDNIAINASTVKLHYRTSTETNFTSVNMTGSNNVFTGNVNGYQKGTTVKYHFTAVDDANEPNTGRYPESGELSFEVLYYNLLILHASGVSSRVEKMDALLSGMDYDTFEADEKTMPSLQYMSDYSDIALDLGYNTMDDDAAQLMVDYLSDNHKVFLFGQNPIDPYTESQGGIKNLGDMLNIEFGYWYWSSTIKGKDGDPIGDGLSLSSSGGGFSGITMSSTDEESAVPFMFSTGGGDVFAEDGYTPENEEVSVGIRVAGDGYRTVLLTFDPLMVGEENGRLLFDRALKWLSAPSIGHEPLKDTEDTSGPYTISAEITDDDLDPSLLDLHYRYEGGSDVKVDLAAVDGKTFTAEIPGKGSPTRIYYYLEATDLAGLKTRSPEKADPSAVSSMFTFYSGPDTTPPVIEHDPLMDDFNRGVYFINASVTDNLGLGDVTLHWRKGGSATFNDVVMTFTGDDRFSGSIKGTSTFDTIEYYITAVDLASSGNSGRSPDEGYHSFDIVETMPVLILDGSYTDIFEGDEFKKISELYFELLEEIGIPYHFMQSDYFDPGGGGPVPRKEGEDYTTSIDLDLLSRYENVFYIPAGWGDNWPLLTDYLDSGGSLLIAPGWIWAEDGWDDSSQIADYIGAVLNEYVEGDEIQGIDGDLIGDGLKMPLVADYAYSLTIEEDFAKPFLTIEGEPCAVHVEKDGYRLVDLAFDPFYLENMTDARILIERIYTFLSGVPTIDHAPHPDTEDTTGPYVISAEISDNNLDSDLVEIHYATGGNVEIVSMSEVSGGIYEGEIPGQAKGTTVYYYISATDKTGNVGTSPFGARESLPSSMHSFYIGNDEEPPVIHFEPFRSSKPKEDYVLEALITDNMGINLSSTKLHYGIQGDQEFSSVPFKAAQKTDVYTGTIPGGEIEVGDVVEYYVEAVDTSSTANSARSPVSGYNTFHIVDRNILVIGDEDAVSGFLSMLRSEGYAFDWMEPGQNIIDSQSSLMAYTSVAWITEPDSHDPINREEAAVLTGYMDRGGNVLLAGDHIAWAADNQGWSTDYPDDDWVDDDVEPKPRDSVYVDNTDTSTSEGGSSSSSSEEKPPIEVEPPIEEEPPGKPDQDEFWKWLSDYFNVEYEATANGGTIEGVDGDPIGDGIQFTLPDDNEVWDWRGSHNTIKSSGNASIIFTDGSGSGGVGVRFEGDHRSVFLSFPLSEVQEEEALKQIITRTVDHLYEGWDNIQNDPPELEASSNHRIEDGEGFYNFTVTYFDAENDPPEGVYLVINSEKHKMSPVDPLDNNYIDGREYFIVLKLDDGSFKYHFETPGAIPTSEYSFSTKGGGAGFPVFIPILIILIILIAIGAAVFLLVLRNKKNGDAEGSTEEKEENVKERSKSGDPGHGGLSTLVHDKAKPRSSQDMKRKSGGAKKGTSKCPFCAKVISVDADRCPGCGSNLAEGLECPKCGSPIDDGANSCPKCGVKFG